MNLKNLQFTIIGANMVAAAFIASFILANFHYDYTWFFVIGICILVFVQTLIQIKLLQYLDKKE